MSNGSITERLAGWVTRLKFEDLPRRVVEECKNQVLSVIATVHAGHFSDAGKIVSRTVREWGGSKEATMIPSGERSSLHNALYANAALSMALDYDDYLFAGHTGHSAVLAALAMGEHLGVSGKDILVAQAAANEIGGRFGAACLSGPLNGQMWSFIHLAGGAVVGAKLLDLEESQTQAALQIALTQPPFPLRPAFFGSDAKILLAANTAPVGLQAAQLAANGLRGCSVAIEGDGGFADVFAAQPLLSAFEGLGEAWLTETLSYKLYPGCAYIDSVIDCVLSLQRQHAIDAKKVKAVHVAANPLTLGMQAMAAPFLKGPESLPVTLNFTIGYNVAAALVDKELTARQFTRERIKDAAVWALAERVTLALDEEMSQRMSSSSMVKTVGAGDRQHFELNLRPIDLAHFKMSFGARVRIDMEDGRSFDAEQEIPFGAVGRTFDDRRKSVEDKFRRETRYTLRKEKMERAVDMILHLETANPAQLRELIRNCCSERA